MQDETESQDLENLNNPDNPNPLEKEKPTRKSIEKPPKNTRFFLEIIENHEAKHEVVGKYISEISARTLDPTTSSSWTPILDLQDHPVLNLDLALTISKKTARKLAERLNAMKESEVISKDMKIDPVFLLYDHKTKEIWEFLKSTNIADEWKKNGIYNPKNQKDYEEYDIVLIKNNNYKDTNVPKGSIGTIVMIHQGNTHYIVEFNHLADIDIDRTRNIAGEDMRILAKYPITDDPPAGK